MTMEKLLSVPAAIIPERPRATPPMSSQHITATMPVLVTEPFAVKQVSYCVNGSHTTSGSTSRSSTRRVLSDSG